DAEAGYFLRQADLGGHVLELEVAEVAEQPRPRSSALEIALADEQVEQPVAVVVHDTDAAGREAGRTGARVLRDVGELTAAEVAEQGIGGREVFVALAVRLPVDGVVGVVEVQQAVVVEVDEDSAVAPAPVPKVFLPVKDELPLDVAEEHGVLGVVGLAAERADVEGRIAAV